MSDLPSGWATAAFDEVVTVLSTTGHVVDTKRIRPAGRLRVYTQGTEAEDGFVDDDVAALPDTGRAMIVFGDHTRALKLAEGRFAVGPNTKVLGATPALVPEFLHLQLRHDPVESRGYGRHFQHLRKRRLRIPPVAEQHRIVAVTDELERRIRAGESRLQSALSRVDHFVARTTGDILDGMVGGRTEPLRELCSSITDGDHQPPPVTAQGVPFLVIGDVRHGHLDFSRCRRVDREYYDRLDERRRPRRGDVLYTLVGSFGIPVLVDTDTGFCVQRHIGILRPSPGVDPRLFAKLLGTRTFYEKAAAIATGTAQKTIPLRGLREMGLRIPGGEEQQDVLERLEADDSRAGHLRRQITAGRAKSQRLRDLAFGAALRGELDTHDPADEPASALLDRIRSERSENRRSSRRGPAPGTEPVEHDVEPLR